MRRLTISLVIAALLHGGVLLASVALSSAPPVVCVSPGKLTVRVVRKKQEVPRPVPAPAMETRFPEAAEPEPEAAQVETTDEEAWVSEADYLRNPPPVYPVLSRRRGEEGTVLVRVDVNEQGRAARVDIHQSSGFLRLDQAALSGIKEWVFTPAHKDGVPVAASILVPIRFVLRGQSS